jgi:hypothetical protein
VTIRTRGRIVRALLAMLSLAGACGQITSPDFCLDIDSSCSGSHYGNGSAIRYDVVGFPMDRVDRSTALSDGGYRGTVHVGDTLSLHLSRSVNESVVSGVQVPASWEIADSSVAHIVPAADGGVLVVAVKTGTLPSLSANTAWYHDVFACDTTTCMRVSQVEVLP